MHKDQPPAHLSNSHGASNALVGLGLGVVVIVDILLFGLRAFDVAGNEGAAWLVEAVNVVGAGYLLIRKSAPHKTRFFVELVTLVAALGILLAKPLVALLHLHPHGG